MNKFMAVLFIVTASTTWASEAKKVEKYFSVYTSLEAKDCMTIDGSDLYQDPEIDFYTGECPGFGGYQTIVSGGDVRYNVSLKFQEQTIELENLASFHDAGTKAEWRIERLKTNDGFSAKPSALIYRLNFDDYSEATGKSFTNTMLVVARLNGLKTCVIGRVPRSNDMNQKAREIADNANAQCL